MAVSYNGEVIHNHPALSSADSRKLNFYLWYLQQNIPSNTREIGQSITKYDPSLCGQRELFNAISFYLNQLINHHEINRNQELLEASAHNLLPAESFQWLNEDQEACYFVWGLMKIHGGKQPHEVIKEATGRINYDPSVTKAHRYTLPSQLMLYSMAASSHQERLQNIQQAFDRAKFGKFGNSKLGTMEEAKANWESARKAKTLEWVTIKDSDAEKWTCQYIESYNHVLRQDFHRRTPQIPLQAVSSPSAKEVSLAINTALRIWYAHEDTIKIFHQNITKAWKQRELRRTRTDKKAINTYISNEAKNKLDWLTKQYRYRMHEVLEFLIDDEYNRHNEKPKK